MLPQSAVEHYRSQQRITAVIVANVRKQWARMGNDFDSSWTQIGPQIVRQVTVGQIVAARQVPAYMTEVLDETNQVDNAVARMVPARLAGVGSDGRPLDELMRGAVITAKKNAGDGPRQALAAGGRWLDMVTQSTIADTARSANAVEIAARPAITGYTRMLNPPSCSRCAILAGATYRWNAGFLRHPRCDCRHIPTTENVAGDLTTDPKAYFRSLDAAAQNKIFTNAGAEAIREGADMGQVINARKGMYTTADGTKATRQGNRKSFSEGVRLMPESIIGQAGSRTEAIAGLRRYGYLR